MDNKDIFDALKPVHEQLVAVNGDIYSINLNEISSFLEQCSKFMEINGGELETMTQVIADNLLESETTSITVEELRTQLKFLRELGFLLRSMATPLSK